MPVPLRVQRGKTAESARSKFRTIPRPAPVEGVNVLDDNTALKPRELEFGKNLWADGKHVILRPGYAEHADTSLGVTARSLIPHELGITGYLFAVGSSTIFDVTTSTVTSAYTGLNSANFSYAQMSNNTVLVNDSVKDYPLRFDGTSWRKAEFTSSDIDTRVLIGVMEHQERLFFWQDNDQDFYFGGLGAVQGALTKFPLTNLGNLEGKLVAGGSWTVDAGDGVQDMAAFIFSKGDIIVYQGSDPSDAENWALVGRFKTGEPVGEHRCVQRYGSELLVLTRQGVVSLRDVLARGRAATQRSISRKIQPLIRENTRIKSASDGWDMVFSPDGSMILVNAPAHGALDTDFVQYVYNPELKAWFHWHDMPAMDWAEFAGDLYFSATDGKVYRLDLGLYDDAGTAIDVEAHLRYDGLENQAIKKLLRAFQLLLISDGSQTITAVCLSDYDEDGQAIAQKKQTYTIAAPGAAWDASDWDEEFWAGDSRHFDWIDATSEGHHIQLRFKFSTSGKAIQWKGTAFQASFLDAQK